MAKTIAPAVMSGRPRLPFFFFALVAMVALTPESAQATKLSKALDQQHALALEAAGKFFSQSLRGSAHGAMKAKLEKMQRSCDATFLLQSGTVVQDLHSCLRSLKQIAIDTTKALKSSKETNAEYGKSAQESIEHLTNLVKNLQALSQRAGKEDDAVRTALRQSLDQGVDEVSAW
mmetsp:Transcript_88243/g.184391  ORF Transcript_88243/g.184391 Transcript_88243/m.184391 type:complete len:175 (+) Transcript_88243:94-618(+)|eukprot:CAMPEP_0194761494 /NCGR_PEP_ID=MMETSP0323_2-20130528/14190_1 /TAXON_ID=2866 ORGANISM="Crypthecodinium cohnii, Strain Seligo" /NCGR_SAMPLE_ID=MMETSP0323_2 /ASSEMBLY_ACC=CAM_ASM_000346 /LENGTH=174 /DNA_ID=CAMNT_0039683255 /DNA_START=54 /DNA_END=575 /DNA_ORIENTATION=+